MSTRQIRGGGIGLRLGAWALPLFNRVGRIKLKTKMGLFTQRISALRPYLLTVQRWKRWYFFRIKIFCLLQAAVIMCIHSCSILTMPLNIDLLHVFNCTTCRLTVLTCRCNNTLDDAEAGAFTPSWFWRVRQKLFNFSDYKAGNSATGDSASSLGVVVVGGRGWLQRVELTLEWPSITFLWEHSGYNNTSPPLSSVSSKLWGWQLGFLHSIAANTRSSDTNAANSYDK